MSDFPVLETNKPLFKILIVDDEKEVLEALEMTLKRSKSFKSDIFATIDPIRAMAEVDKNHYDLVLSDHVMPGISGVDLLAHVKKRNPKTISVLITGYSDMDNAESAMKMPHVDRYVEKPWDNKKLIQTLFDALNNHQSS